MILKSGQSKAIWFLVSSKQACLLFRTEETITLSEKIQSLSTYSYKEESYNLETVWHTQSSPLWLCFFKLISAKVT